MYSNKPWVSPNFSPVPQQSLVQPSPWFDAGFNNSPVVADATTDVIQPLAINNALPLDQGTEGWFTKEGMFGESGWVSPAIQGVGTLMNGWFGLEQLGIAKDQLAENKRQFNLNFGNQARLTNSRLADRQNRRVQEGRSNVSAKEYLSTYGVKGA